MQKKVDSTFFFSECVTLPCDPKNTKLKYIYLLLKQFLHQGDGEAGANQCGFSVRGGVTPWASRQSITGLMQQPRPITIRTHFTFTHRMNL